MMQDKLVKCEDCGKEFLWTVSGQQFFKEKGWVMPRRCRECRVKKRVEYNEKYGDE